MSQKKFTGANSCHNIEKILRELKSKKYFLVCGGSLKKLAVSDTLDQITIPHVTFHDFTPNPTYDDVCKGVKRFRETHCDTILAIGGGSAMDVAKCIKLFSGMDDKIDYLQQEYKDSGIPLIAVPTTAGTGSESTRFAVLYFEGEKQSVAHESIVPNYVILEPSVLKTLPLYQKKCTLLDALCQAMESWWSVNSNEQSKAFSASAVRLIMENQDEYIHENPEAVAEKILLASNYAGRAINITQTTAPHAMSYKLTSLYGLPHGHAVAVCLPKVWAYMHKNPDLCIDPRGQDYLVKVFGEIAHALHGASVEQAIAGFETTLAMWDIESPRAKKTEELATLTQSVNPTRLKNNPVFLSHEVLTELYRLIVRS